MNGSAITSLACICRLTNSDYIAYTKFSVRNPCRKQNNFNHGFQTRDIYTQWDYGSITTGKIWGMRAVFSMSGSVEHLGLWNDDKLDWKIHIDNIYSKLAKFIRIFYKFSHKLPTDF